MRRSCRYCSFRKALVKHARHRQHELGDRRVELRAVFRFHLVAAAHRADRRRDRRAARVLEALAGPQERMFADHTGPADFLDLIGRVGDVPVPGQQLRRDRAGVAERDRVREDVAAFGLVGLFGNVLGDRRDGDHFQTRVKQGDHERKGVVDSWVAVDDNLPGHVANCRIRLP